MIDLNAVTSAAREASQEAVLLALVRTHPDRAAFAQLLREFAQVSFDHFRMAIHHEEAREHAQQTFDSLISRAYAAASK